MTGGTLSGAVSGGNGDDVLTVSGGTIGSFVAGNDGSIGYASRAADRRRRRAGGLLRRRHQSAATSTGVSSTTLMINDTSLARPINLRNGALISGTNAVATITDTDLAAGGTETQRSSPASTA